MNHYFGRALDEFWDPVAVGSLGGESGKGDPSGEWMAGTTNAILVSDMDVLDGNLKVVDDFGSQGLDEALVLCRVLRNGSCSGFEEFGIRKAFPFCGESALVFFSLVVMGTGCWYDEQIEVVDDDGDLLGS